MSILAVVLAAFALIFSVATFYSRTLATMIGAFIAVFALALVAYFVVYLSR